MGQRVLVLEQYYVAGGGSHMFQLKGGLHFDLGLHYLVPCSGLLMWLAIGVRLADGKVVRCERVISSVGYHNTFGKLVPEIVTARLGIPRSLPICNSCGFIMANIGLRGTAEELGLSCANLWDHPTREDGDMFGAIDDFMANPTDPEHDPMIMVTFPSIKDRKGAQTYGDKTTCQILCMAEHAYRRALVDGPRHGDLRSADRAGCRPDHRVPSARSAQVARILPPNDASDSAKLRAIGPGRSSLSSSTDSAAISSPPVRSSNSERLF